MLAKFTKRAWGSDDDQIGNLIAEDLTIEQIGGTGRKSRVFSSTGLNTGGRN
ncbi:hypothetical protein MesoLj131c_26370 [Mesorhizobium sp. 131-3-5]|nr:hypothetical protein MesoLj131c_26370 [Mesorhizobium sp. 131-3-5]